MILARLTRALREQNWFAVVLEFVIVVAGVLLAFQISLLSERQAVQERIDVQIELLRTEMRANLAEIQENIGILETNNANVRELRVQLSAYTAGADATRLNELTLYAFMNPSLDAEHFALDQLEIMEGRASLSGSRLEARMRDWRQTFEVVRSTEENIDSLIEVTNAGSTFEALSIAAMVDSFPRIGLVEPVPVSFDTDWLALSQDSAFADHLAIFALNLEYLWAVNQSFDTATQDLLAAIDERHPE
ncbi:hypothetical protein HXX25_00440 [Hyphobacterium sp. CCMP332]|uniref:hypothetical protein n=1 Tax=Hyphobacterium sp. CCMP332 TaxID=2749086 RepID=UPI00164F2CB8|nr:hypothetical protein [Hyphobacterium sp. CCMP332]QNL17933.1 hypothetical protein HXX25_00440 [Hyphobacterium sp. CCMP332]